MSYRNRNQRQICLFMKCSLFKMSHTQLLIGVFFRFSNFTYLNRNRRRRSFPSRSWAVGASWRRVSSGGFWVDSVTNDRSSLEHHLLGLFVRLFVVGWEGLVVKGNLWKEKEGRGMKLEVLINKHKYSIEIHVHHIYEKSR